MLQKVLIICTLCMLAYAKSKRDCLKSPHEPVCGSDNKVYPSFCHLLAAEEDLNKRIGFQCNGKCPCDPSELKKLDPVMIDKLAKLRKDVQLEGHEKDLDNGSDEIVTLEILDSQNIEGEEDQGFLANEAAAKDTEGCPALERAELPRRLIDWFHVLKTNDREQQFKDEGIKQEPVLKEMKFVDAKLEGMYARLACSDNDDEVEQDVCLPSVKWMFYPMELLEIEEINNEHCIKPFLRECDQNGDKKVVLKEFCKCLCVTPPCTHALESIPTVLINGVPRPFPGLFTPKCDEDGFFMPKQVNKKRGEIWCVDRNGAEIMGSRTNATKKNCGINTHISNKPLKLIPLNMKKENEPIGAL